MSISASAIDLFRGCKRKAAARYWGEEYGWPKPPQGDSAALGSEMHAFGEAYLLHGAQPDRLTLAGEMFISGLPYLPPPASGHVEGRFSMIVAGIEYEGAIDYRGPIPNFGCGENPHAGAPTARVVLDHKSSSSPKRYGLWVKTNTDGTIDKSAFLTHPQPVIYAARDIVEARAAGLPDADQSHLRWLYYQSKGKRWAAPSDVVLTRTEIETAFGEIVHPAAVELSKLKETRPDPLTVEPNSAECNKYGGCPYKDKQCKLSADDQLRGAFVGLDKLIRKKEETMPDLMDLLNQANTLTGGTPAPKAPIAAAPAPAPGIINPPEAAAPKSPSTLDLTAALTAGAVTSPESGVRPASTPAAAASAKPGSLPATPPPPPSAGDVRYVVRVVATELGAALTRIGQLLS